MSDNACEEEVKEQVGQEALNGFGISSRTESAMSVVDLSTYFCS